MARRDYDRYRHLRRKHGAQRWNVGGVDLELGPPSDRGHARWKLYSITPSEPIPAGTVGLLAVTGLPLTQVLHPCRPPNDLFANATVLTGLTRDRQRHPLT